MPNGDYIGLTTQELIEVRATLFSCQRLVTSLISLDSKNDLFYKRELERIEDAKKLILDSITRDIKNA